MKVPFFSLNEINRTIRSEMLAAFEDVLDSEWYILGKHVQQFEKKYAAFNGVKYCVGVSNGLDALHLCLKTLNIKAGDEVIVPSNTYIATALAVSHVGAQVRFAEPKEDSYNFDSKSIENVITKKTKAIIPVHLYGQACEMEELVNVARRFKLFIVEDNAQAHGAKFNGRVTGSWGDVNATSFYPSKNLGAFGDAGAITTDDEDHAKKLGMLRNYGSAIKYENEYTGYNMRLDEIQAAFLSVKLKYLDKWTSSRQQAAQWYNELLLNVGDLVLPFTNKNCTHVYHLYVIRTQGRDLLQSFLKNKGIDTLVHYPIPPHLQKAYKHLGYKKGDLPIAEALANTSLSLPLYPGITKEQVEYVCDCIKDYFSLNKTASLKPCKDYCGN